MTQDELQALCVTWQRRLRLQDWDVTAVLSRRVDLGGPTTEGRCEPAEYYRRARVQVLDPIDHNPLGFAVNDPESTLVHELLHLHLLRLLPEEDTAEMAALEQAINAISEALVKLARGEG